MRRRLVGLLFLFAAVAIGLLGRSVLQPEGIGVDWSGYRSLLVEASIPEAEVLAALGSAGIKDLLSESNQPVLVSNWSGLQSMSYAAVQSQFLPGDPRLDPYIRKLGAWFKARAGLLEYRVFYIRSAATFGFSAAQDLALERGLRGFKGRYLLPGGEPGPASRMAIPSLTPAILLILVAASIAGPLLGRAESLSKALSLKRSLRGSIYRIGFRLCAALPWMALADRALAPALWALTFIEAAELLDMPLDEYRLGRGRAKLFASLSRQSPPSLAFPLMAFLATAADLSLLPALALALLSCLAMILAFGLLSYRPTTRSPFVPLPIGRKAFFRRRESTVAGTVKAILACGLLVGCALDRLLPSWGRAAGFAIEYPLPLPLNGSQRPLVAESRSRAASERGEAVPGLASYLEHRAFQEALPFLRLGEARPDPFAPALLPMPKPEPSTRPAQGDSGNLTGVEFGDGWARTVYASIPTLSVEGMLIRQGSSEVALGSSSWGARGVPLAPIEYLLYIFLLIPPTGRILSRAAPARGQASSEVRQEA